MIAIFQRYLDSVDRMDVLHAIQNDSSNLLQALEWPHNTNSVPLHEDIALC